MTSTDGSDPRERRRTEGSGGFDLSAWLQDHPSADAAAPREESDGERTESPAVPTTGGTDPDGFRFADWLDAGADGSFEIGAEDGDASTPDGSASTPDGSSRDLNRPAAIRRPDLHPVMAATLALFVTAAALTVLTVGGVLPPLGPATGFPG